MLRGLINNGHCRFVAACVMTFVICGSTTKAEEKKKEPWKHENQCVCPQVYFNTTDEGHIHYSIIYDYDNCSTYEIGTDFYPLPEIHLQPKVFCADNTTAPDTCIGISKVAPNAPQKVQKPNFDGGIRLPAFSEPGSVHSECETSPPGHELLDWMVIKVIDNEEVVFWAKVFVMISDGNGLKTPAASILGVGFEITQPKKEWLEDEENKRKIHTLHHRLVRDREPVTEDARLSANYKIAQIGMLEARIRMPDTQSETDTKPDDGGDGDGPSAAAIDKSAGNKSVTVTDCCNGN